MKKLLLLTATIALAACSSTQSRTPAQSADETQRKAFVAQYWARSPIPVGTLITVTQPFFWPIGGSKAAIGEYDSLCILNSEPAPGETTQRKLSAGRTLRVSAYTAQVTKEQKAKYGNIFTTSIYTLQTDRNTTVTMACEPRGATSVVQSLLSHFRVSLPDPSGYFRTEEASKKLNLPFEIEGVDSRDI